MISVVIATYNGEKYIEAQLRSVFMQSLKPQEVLIFDDGSTDNTVEIISRFIDENQANGWRLVLNEENSGYSKNFLNGVLKARGDYIFLSDQDDVWYPDKIKEMAAVLENDSEIKALCCSCDLINGEGEKIENPGNIGVLFSENSGTVCDFNPQSFIGRSFIRGCAVAFRRELLSLIVPMDLCGLLSHDWLITFTAALTGKCSVLKKTLMSYRCHGKNNSFGERKYGKEALQKRINGIKNSIQGHSFILENADSYRLLDDSLRLKLQKQIEFEQKRAAYLENGGISALLKCAMSIFKYKCYYGKVTKGFKVFVGDILYRNR